MKKLIPAIVLLLISAMIMATASYAWFSMNTQVTATGMQVRAIAEQGILINEVGTVGDTNWDNSATANQVGTGDSISPVSLLYPSSTSDGATWYHAASTKSNNAAAASSGAQSGNLVAGYESLSGLTAITDMSVAAVAGSQAKIETMGKASDAPAGYYVHYEYYLKSSGEELTLRNTTAGDQYVSIKSVTATPTANVSGSGSTELNKSLRVGIKLNSSFYIYAPVSGYTASYYVNAGSNATAPIAGGTATATDLATLPASGAAGTKVDVYIWYEGEDAACMTDNATAVTLDNIKVNIVFSLDTRA